jgi:hypothetical protein
VLPAPASLPRHVPEPSQVSGSVHCVSDGSPQLAPVDAWLSRHAPLPSQVSALVQSVSEPSPHDDPAET